MATSIDTGATSATEGYFFRTSFNPRRFVHSRRRLGPDEDRFCFTYRRSDCHLPDTLHTIKNEVLKMIREARKKIFISSFRFGDADLEKALFEAALRLQGGVYLISALDEESLARGLEETDDVGTNQRTTPKSLSKDFASLINQGVYVRGKAGCHAKFVVVDDRVALVSTANLETSAFQDGTVREEDGNVREATGECGVVLHEHGEVGRLARFFARLWRNGCEWELPFAENSLVVRRTPETAPCTVPPPDGRLIPGIIWTYEEKKKSSLEKSVLEKSLLETIHEIIGLAKSELFLATFGLNGLCADRPLLFDLIEASLRRGVRVRMFLRGRNNMSSHCADTQQLAEMGVRIIADKYNHAKAVIADGQYGALFSANFDAAHGLTSGIEVGVRLDGTLLLADVRRYFAHAVANADLKYVLCPDGRTLDNHLGLAQWPKSLRDMLVRASDEHWEEFTTAARADITIFERSDNGDIDLVSGSKRWELRRSAGVASYALAPMGKPSASSAQTLRRWMSSMSRGRKSSAAAQPVERGICSATFTRIEQEGESPGILLQKLHEDDANGNGHDG